MLNSLTFGRIGPGTLALAVHMVPFLRHRRTLSYLTPKLTQDLRGTIESLTPTISKTFDY